MKILKRYKSAFIGLTIFLSMILVGFGINSYFFFAHTELISHLSDWIIRHRIWIVLWHIVLFIALYGLLVFNVHQHQKNQYLTERKTKQLKQFQWLVLISLIIMDVMFLWG